MGGAVDPIERRKASFWFVLRNGFNIPFWDVMWLKGMILKEVFPSLYEASSLKMVSVAAMGGWVDNRWTWGNYGILGNRFLVHEVPVEWGVLRGFLEEYGEMGSEKDGAEWIPSRGDDFSVASCYEEYASYRIPFGPNGRHCDAKKLVWNSDVPFKIKAFGWRLLANRLPTKDLFVLRGIPLSFDASFMNISKGTKRTKITPQILIDMDADRLSSLPDLIIEKILSYIPIKEAIGTSVLSSKWINKWRTLPSLVFDTYCVSIKASEDRSNFNMKFVKIIDHVLLVHYGPINVFKICDYYNNRVSLKTDVDRWILHLTGRSIQELVLEVWIDKQYQIPQFIFGGESVRTLELYRCSLKPPSKFEGFKNLKSLGLYHVTISQDDFENLIFNCSLLESLTLMKVIGVSHINIHAPNLKVLNISDEFEDINFDNACQITSVFVDLRLYFNSENNQSRLHGGGSSNLLKFFNHLPHIEGLAIDNYFLKLIVAGVVPVKLPIPCINLLGLSLFLNFDDLKEISAALCLLRSSPTLISLKIYARIEQHSAPLTPPISENYCWEDTFSKPDTPIHVQHLRINNISGLQPELEFIRFLVLYSPVLEKIIVERNPNVGTELFIEIIEYILRFKSASEIEVIYHENDSSCICILFQSSKFFKSLPELE
ncbi:F-box/FBD/LRR-repeat protein At1g13570-like [Vicia villosa]|uniref:F-box/FBD/LRR-repeat protein At1g13570-like n=1 Tax=Vicia villosa TaxID=3911 RepID=UPI00273CAAD2|nr:F-box/FBD/LRR-repeat protein At1g13570-like [Vicia villosa]